MYNALKDIMLNIAKETSFAIIDCCRNDNRKRYITYYQGFFEAFKTIECICNAINIKAYTQAGALTRGLLEEVTTLQVIIENPKIENEYRKFAKLKLSYITKDISKEEINKIKKEAGVQCSFVNFLEYGWLLKLGEKDLSVDTVFRLSKLDNLAQWRSFYNNYVHHSLSFVKFKREGFTKQIYSIVYNTAICCDRLMCFFHNLTGFNFIFNLIDYRKLFEDQFNAVTNLMNN